MKAKFKAGDLVRLKNLGGGSLGLIVRIRPCEFSGSESNRIYKVTWLRSMRAHEYGEKQLVKA